MGVIVQFGGQTPLNLAAQLEEAGVPIMGTLPAAIDMAEDRRLFGAALKKLKILSPASGIADSAREGPQDRAPHRLPRHGAAGFRAGRGHMRRSTTSPIVGVLSSAGRAHHAPDRPLPRRRHRGRRRRDLRRQGRLRRRHHGAHRGGRHPLGRLRLHAAAALARPVLEIRKQTRSRSCPASACGASSTSNSRSRTATVYILEGPIPRARRTVPFDSKAMGIPLPGSRPRSCSGAAALAAAKEAARRISDQPYPTRRRRKPYCRSSVFGDDPAGSGPR